MKNLLKLLLVLTLFISFTSCQKFSEGERVGIITKFSESGRICKSYEGELKIAPNIASSGMVGQYETFQFSLDNDETIKCETHIDSIETFAKEGIPVVINYQQTKYLNWFANRGDTEHFVKSIERAVPLKINKPSIVIDTTKSK